MINVINMPIKTIEIEMTYTRTLPEGMSEEDAQRKVDQAFDILFNEVEKAQNSKVRCK